MAITVVGGKCSGKCGSKSKPAPKKVVKKTMPKRETYSMSSKKEMY